MENEDQRRQSCGGTIESLSNISNVSVSTYLHSISLCILSFAITALSFFLCFAQNIVIGNALVLFSCFQTLAEEMENSHPLRQNRNSLFREALDSAVTRKPISSSRPKASIPEDDGVSRVSTQGSLRGAPSEVSPVESERFEESLPGPQIPRVLQAPEAPESPPALQTALESPQAQEHSRQKGLLQACHAVPVDSTSFLYLNSPPSRGVSSSFFSQHRNHGWFWELVSCLLSFVSLAAIIIILKHYDGQPAQKWPHPITLNSFLAVFTTLAKAGLVFPVTEALGQLKWVWFGEAERPLIDFQTFDEASRGPIGGIRLLGMLKGRYVAPEQT